MLGLWPSIGEVRGGSRTQGARLSLRVGYRALKAAIPFLWRRPGDHIPPASLDFARRAEFAFLPMDNHREREDDSTCNCRGLRAGGSMTIPKIAALCIFPAVLASCAMQRAQIATDAKTQMVGLSKEQVLACMGPPAAKASEGATEVWSYNSGNGHTAVSTFATGGRGYGSGFGVAEQRFCTVNVTMNSTRVTSVNYVGPTGGLLTQGEQCAFALQNCVQPQ
jgi:hypothetical protein